MNAFSVMSFTAFMAYLAMGIYVARVRGHSRFNRIFILLSILLGIYSFTYGFVYSAKTMGEYDFWYHLSMFGWILIPGATLHFFFVLTGVFPEKTWKRPALLGMLYAPGILFLVRGLGWDLTAAGYTQVSWGFTGIPAKSSPWYWAFIFYFVSYCGFAILICARWGFQKDAKKRQKRQARLIVVTAILSYVGSALFNAIFPIFGWKDIPVLAPVSNVIWFAGIWVAISRYGLLTFSPAIAADEILSRITDMILLVDTRGNIVRANQPAASLLGYQPDEMVGLPILSIIEQGSALTSLNQEAGSDQQIRVKSELRGRDGSIIHAVLMPSRVENLNGDSQGFVVVAQDIELETKIRIESMKKTEKISLLEEQNQVLSRMIQEKKSELDRRLRLLERETAERKMMRDLYNQYDFLINSSGEWMALIGRGYRFEAVNDSLCRFLGKKRDELEGLSLLTAFESTVFESNIKPILDRGFNGEAFTIRSRIAYPPFAGRILESSIAPYRNFQGDVTHIVTLTRDLSGKTAEHRNGGAAK